MSHTTVSILPEVLDRYASELLNDWIREQSAQAKRRLGPLMEAELRAQCAEVLGFLTQAVREQALLDDVRGAEWEPLRETVANIAREKARHGLPPSEIVGFIFSLKRPLFSRLRQELGSDDALAEEIGLANELLDRIGLSMIEASLDAPPDDSEGQKRSSEDPLRLILPLHDKIVLLILIGSLDRDRAKAIGDSLLHRIEANGIEFAILDLSGVADLDPLVVDELLEMIAAARIMGTSCLLCGVSPSLARSLARQPLALGLPLSKPRLAEALAFALSQLGLEIVPSASQS